MDAVIVWSWRPWLYQLECDNHASWEIWTYRLKPCNLGAVIVWGWKCTWRLWSSEIGRVLGGSWWMACQEIGLYSSVSWSATLGMSQCDFTLRCHAELADGGRSCRVICQKLMLHSGVNSWSCGWRENKQSWLDAVLSIYCTWCMLYSVYAALSICCTWCQLRIMEWRDRKAW
jgi:hypothetical protein